MDTKKHFSWIALFASEKNRKILILHYVRNEELRIFTSEKYRKILNSHYVRNEEIRIFTSEKNS